MEPAPAKLMVARWQDAWMDFENLDAWNDECIVTTVGWAVRDTPKVLSLAAEDMGDGTWRGVTHIPRVCILSAIVLEDV